MLRGIRIIVVATLLTASGLAQEERAVVTGTVTDPARASIPGAIIQIDRSATGFHRQVTSNDGGSFLIPGLLVGVYDLKISKDGFATAEYKSFELVVARSAHSTRRFRLRPPRRR